MKKIPFVATLLFWVLLFSAISCKKEEETPVTPTNTYTPAPLGTVEITILNDTVDFSTTSSCFEWSLGMGFDSVSSNNYYSLPVYAIKSNDSSCYFDANRGLEFAAYNGNKLFLADNGNGVKKFSQGQTIDYNTVSNIVSTPQGNIGSRIIDEVVTTSVTQNETFYLGTAFLQNGSYYNGWVKVKTLNNYHSCIILSYGVCKTANTPVTAE